MVAQAQCDEAADPASPTLNTVTLAMLTAAIRAAMQPPLLLKVDEAAALLGMKRVRFYRGVSAGHFPAPVTLPGMTHRRWRRADLEKFLDKLKARR